MREIVGLLLALASTFALETEVIFEEPNGVKIQVSDSPTIKAVKFEVQVNGGKQVGVALVEEKVDDVWEFFKPEMEVHSGDEVRYRVTAFHEGGTEATDWKSHTLTNYARPVRSMKRAVVFRDDFNTFNKADYKIECSAWGGGNHEFQVYVNEPANLYARGGHFYIRPTLTTDDPRYDENRLYHGRMIVTDFCGGGACTQSTNWGCDRTAVNGNVLNPVKSGHVQTHAAIRYGTVTVRARLPRGDWLWPAIWMLPRDWKYGGWPRSGEIDLMEARCNSYMKCGSNLEGVQEVASTLHWGPDAGQNRHYKTHGELDKGGGDWADGYHTYKLEWDANHMRVTVDDRQILYVGTPSNSYWGFGGFGGTNIWASGGRDAPFDQYFQLILNVAVGGQYFPQGCSYNHPRPWHDGSQRQEAEFWEKRSEWLSTWHGESAAMAIDYVEMVQA